MSRKSEATKQREQLLRELELENRRSNVEGLSYLQAVAERSGMNLTDLHCINILALTGPISAGRLGEMMGLTTGGHPARFGGVGAGGGGLPPFTGG